MTDYIKREDAIEQARRNWCGNYEWIAKKETRLLNNLPSADVVEVVRCKDCIHYNEYASGEKIIDEEEVCDGWCMRWSGIENVNRHDYCSYGEEKHD